VVEVRVLDDLVNGQLPVLHLARHPAALDGWAPGPRMQRPALQVSPPPGGRWLLPSFPVCLCQTEYHRPLCSRLNCAISTNSRRRHVRGNSPDVHKHASGALMHFVRKRRWKLAAECLVTSPRYKLIATGPH
jgi:hypothetical protein